MFLGKNNAVKKPAASTPKTPYQQNVAQPVQQDKWYKGSQPTTRETLGQILRITQQDQQRGMKMQSDFQTLQQDSTSMFYAPYTKATNQSVSNLNAMGIDTSKIDDDWFAANSGLNQYLTYSGTTNTPSKPGKKASALENAAYEYYQIGKANDLTKKAKTEWAALQQEAVYWANRRDRNYSDDQIVDKIYGKDFAKKYPTLAAMDESLKPGRKLLELNEGINYSRDAVYGTIWAARNEGGTGNIWQDMAWSALGEGNQWQENKDITARLDSTNKDTYAPYTVGSTRTMDDVCLYYNRPSFDMQWLQENKPDGSDETETNMWNKAYDAELFTEQAEQELAEANEWLNRQLQNAKTPKDAENIMNSFDRRLRQDWSSLKKMDDSLNKVDALIGTTRAINYSHNDIQNKVYQKCGVNAGKKDSQQTLQENGLNVGTNQSQEAVRAGDQKIREGSGLIEGVSTEMEQNVLSNTPTTIFGRVMQEFQQAASNPYYLLTRNEGDVTSNYAGQSVTLFQEAKDYRTAKAQLDSLNRANDKAYAKLQQIRDEWEAWNDPENEDKGEKSDAIRAIDDIYNNVYISDAMADLYKIVTGRDLGEGQNAIREAGVFYDYVIGTKQDGDEDIQFVLNPDYLKDKAELEAEVERTAAAPLAYKAQQWAWNARIAAYDQAGLDSTGLRTAKTIASTAPFFEDYEKTEWTAYNKYGLMIQRLGEGASFEDVKNEAKVGSLQVEKELEYCQFIRDYIAENNVQMPESYMAGLNSHIAKLEQDQVDYNYFVLQGEKDFDQMAEKGKDLEDAARKEKLKGYGEYDTGDPLAYGLYTTGAYQTMTEEERQTYYYLYGKEGADSAKEYFNYLMDGVLNTRTREEIEAYAANEVNSGVGGAILANAKALLLAPVDALTGIVYNAKTLINSITGEETNPDDMLRSSAQYSTAVNKETVNAIKENLGEDTFLGQIALGGYEIAYNRGRSFVNSMAFGFLTNGLSSDILKEIVGAIPMASDAAATTIADALDKGAEPWQAMLLGGISFLSESLTEGITYRNIQEALHGGGGNVARSVKDLLINWLTKSGVDEMIGETATEIIEKVSDTAIMGALSEHEAMIDHYLQEMGATRNDFEALKTAEEMARKDEIAGILHTALISYLSPGLDVISGSVSDKVRDFNNIRSMTRDLQHEGFNVSMLDVKDDYYAWKERQQYAEANAQQAQPEAQQGETAQQEAEAAPAGTAVAETTAAEPARTPSQADNTFLSDLGKLDAVANADNATQAAAIGALFGGEENTNQGDMAKAAAATITNLFGGDMNEAVQSVKGLLLGAHVAFANETDLKFAVQVAALDKTSAAATVIASPEFKTASPEQRAVMVAETAEQDRQNPAVIENIAKTVREYRVAEAQKELIANGALDGVKAAQQEADKAAENLNLAQESLEEKHAEVIAKGDAFNVAMENVCADPTDDNYHEFDRARNELEAAQAVEQEYEQHLASIERANEDAQAKLTDVKNTAMKDVREQAEQKVAEIDQQRAQAAEQVEQQAKAKEEEAARLKAEEDIRTGKAEEDHRNSIIEQIVDNEHLEGDAREARINELKEQTEKVKIRIKDLNQPLNNTEGLLTVHAFGRKIGLPIELADLGKVDSSSITRGKYVYNEKTGEAKIVLNQNLLKSGKMSVGQALVETSLHELVHSMRKTNSYNTFRNVVMQSVFNAGDTVDSMDLYNENSGYRAKIDFMIQDRINAGDPNFVGQSKEYQVAQAEEEIVADFARMNLAEKDIVQRIVDAGIGGRMRNALHNINQALKNYFGGLTGEARQRAEYLRRAERAYQKAIIEAAKSDIHPNSSSFSVTQFAESMNLDLVVNDDTLQIFRPDPNGDIIGDGTNGLAEGQRYIELDGVTDGKKITPDMIVNTPVGMLIDMGLSDEEFTGNDGAVHTQKGDARQMFADLMNLCARYKDNNLIWEIAGSEFSEAFSALKSNSDPQYKNTVDFGTICSKTQAIVDVLSQTMVDRVNAIREWNAEHAAEIKAGEVKEKVFTGLTRTDIMEIYNRTHNAGLSVPCPVCYVFSRWMGVPGMLGQMNRFQHEYVALQRGDDGQILYDENGDAIVDWDETFNRANGYLQGMVHEYTKTKDNPDGIDITDPSLTLEERNAAIKLAKDKIADKKNSINNKIRTRQKSRPKLYEQLGVLQEKLEKQDLTEAQEKKVREQIAKKEAAIRKNEQEADQFMEDIKEFEAFNWVSQVVCVQHTEGRNAINDLDENGNFVMDKENFRYTPEEILFDLNRSGEFAGYAKNWRYRTTRGAGMGKAIMPYSGASIGDIIHGDAIRWKQSENPLLQMDRAAAKTAYKNAVKRVKQQNLVGGQRFQSTSDFRPEWGLDYIMSFLEMQALGSKVQMYTKVAEAVDFLGSIGADVNLSIMAKNNGYHIATDEEIQLAQQDTDEGREMKSRMGVTTDENGKSHMYVMEFSDVTGMDYSTAKAKTKKFNNVQMILVGMNDIHIRLALGNADIDFVIPWHSSGNSKDVLQSLVSSVGEQLLESSDYTDFQTDKIKSHEVGTGKNKKTVDDRTEAEIKLWDARVKLLTEGGESLTEEERNTLLNNDITKELYRRFTEEGYDPDCFGVKLTKDQAEQVFPYEYWDKNSTRENADVNGERFVAYCDALGLVPRFSQFKDVPGYWKLLIDRKMYDNNTVDENGNVVYGKYRDQQVVDVTKARMDNDPNEALDEKTRRKKQVYQLPEETTAKYGRKNYSEQTEAAIRASNEYLSETYDVTEQRSDFGELTEADRDLMSDANTDYMDAISRGDMEAAQEDVDYYAEQAGYDTNNTAFHGTDKFGFTEFDMGKSGNAIYVSFADSIAETYAHKGSVRDIHESDINHIDYDPAAPEQILQPFENNEKIKLNTEKGWRNVKNVAQTSENTFVITISTGETQTVTGEELADIINTSRNRAVRGGSGIYRLFTRPGNQLVIDADGADWNEIYVDFTDDPMTTRSIAYWAKKHGYDSVRINNVYDYGPYAKDFDSAFGDIGIFFNQGDVKSADPVTYDDNGNVIPLNQRFSDSPDIRYSDMGELTEADMDLMGIGEENNLKSDLEKMTGKPLSAEFKNALERLQRNESLTREEYQQIPELIYGSQHVREGFSINPSILKKYDRYGDTYIQDVQSELSPEQVAEQKRIKDELDSQGSILGFDEKGKPIRGGEIKQGHRLDIIIGLAAAGKSSIADYISYKHGSGFLDSDDVKKLIEGYDNGLGASYTHPESKFINEWREREAIARGDNVILPVVGDDPNGVLARLQAYMKEGYNIHLHMVDLPQNKAIGRALQRYNNTGRYINVDLLLGMDPVKIAETFDILKGGRYISGYSKWNNDVPFGEHPTVIEASDAGETELFGNIQLLSGLRTADSTEMDTGRSGNRNGAGTGNLNGSRSGGVNENGTANQGGAFSVGGELTEADRELARENDLNNTLIQSGVLTQEEVDRYNGNLPGMPLAEGGAQRQFGSKTAQTSDALHDEVKDYLYTHSDYTPDSNQAQINRSMDWVQSHANESDPDGYRGALEEVLRDDFDYRSADGQARMLTVMSMAALKANSGDQTAMADELRLADAYNQQGTDIGRQLQARKIFRLMTPVGRRNALNQEVARINTEYANTGSDTRVHLSDWVLRAAEAAETEEDFERVRRAAEQELAEQMPANWKDKLRTWRMMSMLANPRTHIRNILGNWIFQPVVQLKNVIGAGLESKFVKEGEERTKAIRYTDDAEEFAAQDVQVMRDTLTGEAKYTPEDRIKQDQKAFGQGSGLLSRTIGKTVQNIADFNSDMLEAEDWIFLSKHYQNALAGYMTANGLTSEDMENSPETLQKARTYAVLEAQKATYRDANWLSSWLNKASREGGVKGFLVDAVLPFKKTPANILRRGIEYSPIGLLKSFATAKKSLDLYAAWEANGRKGNMPKGAKSMTQVLDGIASGLTGTGIAALGALGYALGAVKLGFGGDDDDELEKERGSQEYSIELFGHSFTIDWAAPVCMPFFTGAALMKSIQDNNGEISIGQFIDSLTKISEPAFNLSMLDSVNNLLKSVNYSNGIKIPVGELLQKIGANYVSSFVPSALGATARTIDTTRRKTYVESGADLSVWRSMLEQVQNKIPFLSMRNIPYRNVWGEAEESGRVEAFLENFVLPGYVNQMSESKLDTELQRLFDEGETGVVPKSAAKTVGGVKLNDQEYDQYVVTRGQTAKALLEELIERPEYVALTGENPAGQAQLMADVWAYANAVARYELFPDYKMDKWIAEAYASGNAVDAAIEREESKAMNAYAEEAKTNLFTSINEQNAEAIATDLEALHQAGKDDKSIRTTVMNYYRDFYKEAYLNGDQDEMDAIKYGMLYLDLGEYSFTDDEDDKNSIFNKWKKDAEKGRQ